MRLPGVHVAIRGEEIASSVRVVPRRLHMGVGKVLGCGGIGDVSTRKAHRGKGLAKILLRRAVEAMRTANAAARKMRGLLVDVSSLHSSRFAWFYAKLGWVAIPLRYAR